MKKKDAMALVRGIAHELQGLALKIDSTNFPSDIQDHADAMRDAFNDAAAIVLKRGKEALEQ